MSVLRNSVAFVWLVGGAALSAWLLIGYVTQILGPWPPDLGDSVATGLAVAFGCVSSIAGYLALRSSTRAWQVLAGLSALLVLYFLLWLVFGGLGAGTWQAGTIFGSLAAFGALTMVVFISELEAPPN